MRGALRRIDAWLVGEEPFAASRLGLYRIFYALFYLWHLHAAVPANLAGLPREHDHRMAINFFLPRDLPPAFYDGLLAVVVAALVWLLVGYRTRVATFAVGAFGALLESCFVDVDIERSTVFLTAFVPLFMLLFGDWGATWSLDAALRRARGERPVAPGDASPRFVLPIRATLAMLALVFCNAGFYKAVGESSQWFAHGSYFADLTQRRYVDAALAGLPLNPLPQLFARLPALDTLLRWFVVLFELSFPLALVAPRLRAFYLGLALLFHAVNGIWLGVTFTTILAVYPLFFDWESLRRRIRPGRVGGRSTGPRVSEPACALGVPALAIGVALAWTTTRIPQAIVSLGGLLDPVTLWFPVLPIAAFAVVRAGLRVWSSR